MLEKLFDEARSKVGEVTKDSEKYSKLLENLILQVHSSLLFTCTQLSNNEQSLYSMMESEVTVMGRKKDSGLVKKAIDTASSTYQKESGKELKISQGEDLSDELYVCAINSRSFFERVTNVMIEREVSKCTDTVKRLW